MNVQLLLLLALVGPFCAFTHASTELPVASVATGTAAAKLSTEDVTLVTSSATNEPAMAPEGVTPEDITGAAPPSVTVNTEEPVVETHAPAPAATEAPKPITTDPPSVETAAPSTEAEFQSKVTAAAETKMDEEVHKGGLSSGQVVGIVIGALLAVVIVIAVVIATVRRMGKYSSAKNKKPAKKDSIVVSSLRKKPAKQQERPKFWKF